MIAKPPWLSETTVYSLWPLIEETFLQEQNNYMYYFIQLHYLFIILLFNKHWQSCLHGRGKRLLELWDPAFAQGYYLLSVRKEGKNSNINFNYFLLNNLINNLNNFSIIILTLQWISKCFIMNNWEVRECHHYLIPTLLTSENHR